MLMFLYILYKECTKPSPLASIKESLDLVGLPIITFELLKNDNSVEKMNFILDTGATCSFINKKWEDILETSEDISYDSITGFGGTVEDVVSKKVTLYYNDKEFNEVFCFVDLEDSFNEVKQNTGVQLHGIVGSNFFSKYRYIIDFNDLKIYSK